MIDRVLPLPEKFASCPRDEKILAYYEGQFEAVYVLLHPFLKPNNLDLTQFTPDNWPTKLEIIADCSSVSWHEVLKLTGLQSISDIDVGLRTSIGGLRKELSNNEFSNRLLTLTNELNVIIPSEGDLPPLLENRVFNAIKKLGYDWLWLGDEFATERKLHWIDDLIENDALLSHGCVFTHDHSLLIATHWDSHCSFLCSSKETIGKILASEDFEGFYCTPETEVYWGAYSANYNR